MKTSNIEFYNADEWPMSPGPLFIIYKLNNIEAIEEDTEIHSIDSRIRGFYIKPTTTSEDEELVTNAGLSGSILYTLYANNVAVANSQFDFTKVLYGSEGVSITGITDKYWATKTDTLSDSDLTATWYDNVHDTGYGPNLTFLWNYEITHFSDGTSRSSQPALLGSQGVGIKAIKEYYKQTGTAEEPAKPTSNSENGWKTGADAPNQPTSKLPSLWNVEKIEYTDGVEEYTDPVLVGSYVRSIVSIQNYYLATKKIANLTTPNASENEAKGGWQESISAAGFDSVYKYLWNYEKITYDRALSNGSIYSETTPEVISTWSKSIDTIEEYYLLSKSFNSTDFNSLSTFSFVIAKS
jgi:hypothetical protein